jgi:hypothetical protein
MVLARKKGWTRGQAAGDDVRHFHHETRTASPDRAPGGLARKYILNRLMLDKSRQGKRRPPETGLMSLNASDLLGG